MKRLIWIVLALVVALPLAGALYQTLSVRRDAARFPPPGRLVDVGGRRLHLLCTGSGQPTVLFEASLQSSSVSFAGARAEISRHARVCSYDRMGTGWSDPGPAVISIGALADDLDRLLDRALASPPYIVEAASIGGLVVELYARRHPDRVAGLVFVDAGQSDVLDWIAPQLTPLIATEACLLPMAARIGLLRALNPLGIPPSDPDAVWRLYRVEPMATFCGLVRGFATTREEFRGAPPLPADVPMTVLTAERRDGLIPFGLTADNARIERQWRGWQEALSKRSSRAAWRTVPGSDHLIGNSQPHAVAVAVLEMVDRARMAPREGRIQSAERAVPTH